MPPNKNSSPPDVMTVPKALPILILAVLFDVARMFFQLFWFFGPALASAYCTNTATGVVGSLWGLTAAACTAGAATLGVAAVAPITGFGVVMAMAVGLAGFLILGLCILIGNRRLLKAQASGFMWLAGGFGISQIPFIGTLPSYTIVLSKLYRTQIKVERAAYKKWQSDQAAAQLQMSNQQAQQQASLQQVAQQQQFMKEQEAANDALEEEAAQREEDRIAEEERAQIESAEQSVPRSPLAGVPNYSNVIPLPRQRTRGNEIPGEVRKAA
jgi:signal transduction histidine kinase